MSGRLDDGRFNADDIQLNADLNALNDLRSAMYDFEYKTVNNLQLVNGGGAAILIGFLSKPEITCAAAASLKWTFFGAVISFIVGLMASLWLAIIFPSFMEARYRRSTQQSGFNKIDVTRKTCMCIGVGGFLLAVFLSVYGWISI